MSCRFPDCSQFLLAADYAIIEGRPTRHSGRDKMDRETTFGEASSIRSTKDETRFLIWGSLLYSIFWFAEPLQRHSVWVWAIFLCFYGLFLTGYLRVLHGSRTEQRGWLILLFVLGYIYYPFNPNAGGEFVFAVVISGIFLQQQDTARAFRNFAAILAAQIAGLCLETGLLHMPWGIAKSVVFYMVLIGLSNFMFARQVFVSRQLRQANEEIERLTQIAERERIARDLHDLLGHTLTVIAVKSDVANRLFFVNPEMAQRELSDVEATAREALREVRSAVTGYRADGIAVELSNVRRALNGSRIQLFSEIEDVALSAVEGYVLCLVMREAVTNILRHAHASECHIHLSQSDSVRLTIRDNGSGKRAGDGNGIRGMRERLQQLDGFLSVETLSTGGVSVMAQLPSGSKVFSPDVLPVEKGVEAHDRP